MKCLNVIMMLRNRRDAPIIHHSSFIIYGLNSILLVAEIRARAPQCDLGVDEGVWASAAFGKAATVCGGRTQIRYLALLLVFVSFVSCILCACEGAVYLVYVCILFLLPHAMLDLGV